MNKRLRQFAGVAMIATLIAGNGVYADVASPELEDTDIEVQNNAWKADDFEIKNGKIYGFSDKGMAKLKLSSKIILPSLDGNGNPITEVGAFAFVPNKMVAIEEFLQKDTDMNSDEYGKDWYGETVEKIGGNFKKDAITSVVIPEGYKVVGQDAFRDNENLTQISLPSTLEHIKDYGFAHIFLSSLTLPNNLKKIDDTAFFEANIQGTLEIPGSVEKIGERAFKNNKITNVVYLGNKVNEIKEQTFEDNKIKNITIPNTIMEIGENAFNGNSGDPEYGKRVVINVSGDTNLKDKENYYINPSDEKKTTKLDVDASNWDLSDFVIENGTIQGFSEIGKIKIGENKNLELPDEDKDGNPIIEIGSNAFRNIDFDNETYTKFDIENIKLPKRLVKIDDYAFQSNYIQSVEMPDTLKEIGKGAFMNNKINFLSLNDGLERIDDAAFHINKLDMAFIPDDVTFVGRSAFRKNNIENLFITAKNLTELHEMAFLENSIVNLDLTKAPNLKSIGVQVFGENKLEEVSLPESLEEIKEEAFVNNNLTKVNLPKTVKRISFNAFDGNLGDSTLKKVIINTDENKNINKIGDGNAFVVDPMVMANGKEDLKAEIKKVEDLNKEGLRESTKIQFEHILKEGKELLESNVTTQGRVLKYIHDTDFFLNRVDLDRAIKRAELAKKSKVSSESDMKNLNKRLEYVIGAYNNAAVNDQKVKRLTKEMNYLSDLVNKEGMISKAHMVQGVNNFHSGLPIPDYYIGLNVYFDDQGKILFVYDMSYTIGEGTKSKYGVEILNVDEDNEGYHELALKTLDQYEGRSIDEILNSKMTDLIHGYGEIEKYHVDGIYDAVKDAAKDAKKELEESKDKTSETNVDNNKDNKDNNKDNKKDSKTSENAVVKDNIVVKNFEDTRSGGLIFSDLKAPVAKNKTIENKTQLKSFVFKPDSKEYVETTGEVATKKQLDVAPFIYNDRIMLPIRYIANCIGATVDWNSETRTASFTKNGKTIKIQVDGDKIELSDGTFKQMDAKGVIKEDRYFLSLSNIAKALNMTSGDIKDGIDNDIEWNGDLREVTIKIK